MKILHINASYKPAYVYGGPTMSVSALCEQLVGAGIIVEVFTTTANGNHELDVKSDIPVDVDGVTVTYFKRITKDHTHFSPLLLKTLRARIKEFDLIHIHAWWNLVSVLAALTAVKKRVPVVLSPRGTLSAYSFVNRNNLKKKLIHLALGKKLLHKCHVHATAEPEARAVAEMIKPLSVNVIPNFVKLPDTLPVDTKDDLIGPIKLLFLSRIEEKKDWIFY
ncbi:MAG: glycosyltransferase [Mucilaginibacter sp.]|nr:glycosyltransferase [Mucilaginibacter sp.]